MNQNVVLPRWQSHKHVRADRIASIFFEGEPVDDVNMKWELDSGLVVQVSKDLIARGAPAVGDYFVLYEDGYRSWSPKAAFEGGYTRIDHGQPDLSVGLDFAAFKAGDPAQSIFRAMGLQDCLDLAVSFIHLRRLMVDYNDCDEGHFVKAARRYARVCSSGERVLLHAICYVTDFAWLADELDKEHGTWRRFDRVSGPHRRAVLACLAAEV